jgi:hypothetical protein
VISFLVGVFVGSILGMLVMALAIIGRADEAELHRIIALNAQREATRNRANESGPSWVIARSRDGGHTEVTTRYVNPLHLVKVGE